MKRDVGKKRALHRGLADIIENDAAKTSELLEKIKPQSNRGFSFKEPHEPNTLLGESTVHSDSMVLSPAKEVVQSTTFVSNNTLDQKDQVDLYKNTDASNKTSVGIPLLQKGQYLESTVIGESRVSQNPYIKVPLSVVDQIAKILSPIEWSIYFRLFRLSHGFNSKTCIVGVSALIEATNISEDPLRKGIKRLVEKGLIEIIEVLNSKEIKGTRYQVNTLIGESTVPKTSTVLNASTVHNTGTVLNASTVLRESINKDHDHDHEDLLKIDHHQRETMTFYKNITGNRWSKSDQNSYAKIKDIPLETIRHAIFTTNNRASQHPGSLAYFVKEILNLANPKSNLTPKQKKRHLENIVNNVRETHLGQNNYTMAEFSADVKDACAREGIPFDPKIFNDIIDKRSI